MSDILCIYYSRTGNTKKTMKGIAASLSAELVELSDGAARGGPMGWLRSGMDAMRRTTLPVTFETQRPLSEYRLVIIGSPIWAGRCSSVARGFLKEHGQELQNVAYVLLRGSDDKNEDVYEQMDLYVPRPRIAAVSLRRGSVGYVFWKDQFLHSVREFMNHQEEQK